MTAAIDPFGVPNAANRTQTIAPSTEGRPCSRREVAGTPVFLKKGSTPSGSGALAARGGQRANARSGVALGLAANVVGASPPSFNDTGQDPPRAQRHTRGAGIPI